MSDATQQANAPLNTAVCGEQIAGLHYNARMALGAARTLQEALLYFNPQRALQGEELKAFYAERGSMARRRMLAYLQLADRQPVRLLFTGHAGSGKSTELNKLVEELGERLFVVTVRTDDIVAPTELTYVDVILISSMALFRKASDERLIRQAPAQIVEGVWDQAGQMIDRVIFGNVPYRKSMLASEAGVKIGVNAIQGLTLEFETRYKSDLNARERIRAQMKDRLSEVIANVNLLCGEIQHRYRKPVLFIIEDTDKPEKARAEDLFFNHPQTLTGFNASVIYTFPVELRYTREFGNTRRYFTDLRLTNLPLLKRDNTENPDARQVLYHVMGRRIQSNLMQPGVRDMLVAASGGVMRDLIVLAQEAVSHALARGAEVLAVEDAYRAIDEARKNFEAALRFNDYPYLAARDADKLIGSDEQMQELLRMRALLEYENGDIWCDVHPVVRQLLRARAART